MYFVLIYENRRMKSVEIVLKGGGEEGEDAESESKIYCKHIHKCHNVSPCTTMIC
jgi:hypothetical protein